MKRRYGLRDDQWDRIKDLLPGREGHVGGRAKDNRLFVEGVLYRYGAGIAWRDLPERFGNFYIPPKSNRIIKRTDDPHTYKARHLIENFFANLKQYRAIAIRYDKRAVNFLAAIYLAASITWLN